MKLRLSCTLKGSLKATDGWSQKVRNFLIAHGSSYDPKIGQLIHNNEIIIVAYKNLVGAFKQVQEGSFHPDRENGELTKALKNKEHPGRTRGFGPYVPWKIGFSGDDDTYRSRSRSKKQHADRLHKFERDNLKMYDIVKELQLQQDPGFDSAGNPCQLKSSVASPELVYKCYNH
jgi:hypothetical protein